MNDELFSALAGQKADYIEIRLDQSSTSRLAYRGDRLEEAGRSASTGGNVRALVRGGWGFVTFNTLDGLAGKVALAVEQAKKQRQSQHLDDREIAMRIKNGQ